MTSKQDAIRKCNYLSGGARSECLEMVDLCAAGKTTITTDDGEIRMPNVESCFKKAPTLTGMGYEIISGKAPTVAAPISAPKPEPTPTPTHDEPEVAPQPPSSPASPPASNFSVTPMRENETRAGFCTERTGFLPISRATLLLINGSPRLLVDGKPMDQGFDPIPILSHNVDRDEHRVIMLPYREVHFKLGKAEPVRKSKFKNTIGRMVDDIKNIMSGPFAKICNLDYLKEFAGDLTLYVVGRTDRLGTEELNLELSEARAKTVANAIDKRKDEISKALWGGGRGLKIMYLGVGESLAETSDDVASPDDRRVELHLSTEGPPVEGRWIEIGGSAESADPSNYLEYYCGGADSDCKNVLAQCETSLKVMCGEAYPFSSFDRERCAAETGAWMAAGEVGNPEVRRWIENGYFKFPIIHGAGIKYVNALGQCLRKAPAVAQSHYVSPNSPSRIVGSMVADPKAVRGTIPGGTSYCTAEHGWMESSRTTITETPRGEMLWYDGKPVATIGSHLVFINKRGDKTIVAPSYMVDLDGDNVAEVASEVTGDLVDWIFEGDFTRECIQGSMGNVFGIDFFADSIDEKIQRKVKEVLEIVQAMLMEYEDKIPRDTKFMMRFNLIDPYGKHRGLFVGPSLPVDYGFVKRQGTYGPRPKNGDGSIEVIPLK